MVLRALAHCRVPTSPINVSGPDITSVRWLAHAFGERFGKTPLLTGTESLDGWVTNTAQAMRLFGYPSVPLARMVDWQADWISRGLPSLGKDTHFDTRDGTF
jgi:hypothetical protein